MTETVLIFDEAEARAATEAHMRQTARRYGIGGQGEGPITEVGGARAHIVPSPPQRIEVPPLQQPYELTDDPGRRLLAPPIADHLLLTPSSRPGQLRLVRMRGAQKLDSWTIPTDAAATVALILSAFGITLTDLRESEEEHA